MDELGLTEIDLGPSEVVESSPETNPDREVCIVMTGSVDAGKSTLIGVLFSGDLDDGNGKARNTIAKHPHEIEGKRTSDISTRLLKLDDRRVELVDLCGHEKYLKTTIFGITGHFPDYGIVMVSASKGILHMTKEHLAILIYLQIPFVVIITKIDIAPADKYARTLKQIEALLRHRDVNKTPILISTDDEYRLLEAPDEERDAEAIVQLQQTARQSVDEAINRMEKSTKWVPVVSVSNKTGYHLGSLRSLLRGLRPRARKVKTEGDGGIFYINSTFTPVGVGLVISGTLFGESVSIGDELFIGPVNKEYVSAKVWSMHNNNRESITRLDTDQEGCFAIRITDKKIELKRNQFKKGMVAIKGKELCQNTCLEFTAEIEVLHHRTHIASNYTPMINYGTISQPAKITIPPKKTETGDEKKTLKTGDTAEVTFRFISHPQFIEKGMSFFFREGRTRGFGRVVDFKPLSDDPDPPAGPGRRRRFFRRRKKGKTPAKKINVI